MKTAIGWGACLVIAATSASAFANEGAGARNVRGVEHQTVMIERYPDADVAVNDRPDEVFVRRATSEGVEAGAASAAPSDSKDENASFDERWVREREGYRDGGY